MKKKPVILTFVGNYLPGYKAGGILRTLVNMVDHLCGEFDFKIVTKDHDLGEKHQYPNIKVDQWQRVGNSEVKYLSTKSCSLTNLTGIITSTPHDVLFLNSFFDPFTVKVLLLRMFGRLQGKPIIVAPWGEFAWPSLRQKYLKKYIFMKTARLLRFYSDVVWRASSEYEAADIVRVMNVNSKDIHIAGDFPIKNIPAASNDNPPACSLSCREGLRLVFLSRISREKNLDYALKILSKVKAKVSFDIYGPTENMSYWKECQALIGQLPKNVEVKYFGIVKPNEVVKTFGRYDLFLFPTGGEAYGHVIAEALTAGTPVLISTDTPWRNLKADGLGWDIDLGEPDGFVDVIESLAMLNDHELINMRAVVKSKVEYRLLDPATLHSNRQLFLRN